MLERASISNGITSASKNKNVTEDLYINEAIKKCEWRQLIVDITMVEKLKVQMRNSYSLDGFVVERLHFSYETHTIGRNKNVVVLEEDGDISEYHEFKYANVDEKFCGIGLIKMQVQMIFGDKIKED